MKKRAPTKAQFIRVAKKAQNEDNIRIEIRGGKAKWTNGRVMVFDDPVLRDIKGGKYTIYGKAIVSSDKPVPKPDLPDRRRYALANTIRYDGMFQMWRSQDRDLVPLQSKDYRVYMDWAYYDYLFRNFVRLGKLQWKITHPRRPILLYCNGGMVAVVIPVRMEN